MKRILLLLVLITFAASADLFSDAGNKGDAGKVVSVEEKKSEMEKKIDSLKMPGAEKKPAESTDPAINEILAAHNKYRSILNIAPLKWSDKLAANAKIWAERLARERRMYHSSGGNEGENLWMGSAGHYTLTNMVDRWGDEKRYFKEGTFPRVSTSGNWSDVGHYTQIIWRNTTDVGCAKSTGGGYDYFVCRYSPPGNYIGQKVY